MLIIQMTLLFSCHRTVRKGQSPFFRTDRKIPDSWQP